MVYRGIRFKFFFHVLNFFKNSSSISKTPNFNQNFYLIEFHASRVHNKAKLNFYLKKFLKVEKKFERDIKSHHLRSRDMRYWDIKVYRVIVTI